MTASNMAFTFMKLEKENSKFEIIGILIFNPFALFSEVAAGFRLSNHKQT